MDKRALGLVAVLAFVVAGCDVGAAARPTTRPAGQQPAAATAAAAIPTQAAATDPGVEASEPVAASPSPGLGDPAPAGSGTVRLMAVGDVNLARAVGRRIKEHGPSVVFAGVQDTLDLADLLVINLECTISTRGTAEDKHYTFRAPPIAADALSDAGVDIAGQANNHGMDFGPQALADTRSLLKARGIGDTGAGPNRAVAHAPVIVEKNGLRIAFLAYVAAFTESTGFNTSEWEAGAHTPGLAIGRPKGIRADVESAKAHADLVVVAIHAGYEGVYAPNRLQMRLAHAALAGGATLVLGAHPHVLQGIERDGGRLIVYSLGDFVFSDMPRSQRESAIMDVTLTRDGVSSLRWVPVFLDHGLPVHAHGDMAKRILRHVRPI